MCICQAWWTMLRKTPGSLWLNKIRLFLALHHPSPQSRVGLGKDGWGSALLPHLATSSGSTYAAASAQSSPGVLYIQPANNHRWCVDGAGGLPARLRSGPDWFSPHWTELGPLPQLHARWKGVFWEQLSSKREQLWALVLCFSKWVAACPHHS